MRHEEPSTMVHSACGIMLSMLLRRLPSARAPWILVGSWFARRSVDLGCPPLRLKPSRSRSTATAPPIAAIPVGSCSLLMNAATPMANGVGSMMVRGHTNVKYNPTRWPQSPRIVVRCAARESNGLNHLGLSSPSGLLEDCGVAALAVPALSARHGLHER